ncbi:MAG: amidohydrolase [Ethanoligenens sp.]
MKEVKVFLPDCAYIGDEVQKNVAVAVRAGVIEQVGPAAEIAARYSKEETIRLSGRVLLPGTVNVHNHSFQSLLRGIAADRPFLEWRDRSLYKYSQRLTPDDLYIGALFAFGEMLRCGVTTVCDFFYVHNDGTESDEAIIRAAKELGIRLVLARTMYDWDGAPAGYVETIEQACDNTRALAHKYQDDPDVTVVPAPHSLHAASVEMVQAGCALAEELNTAFHIHVAEEPFEVEQVQKEHGGLTPVELLDRIGVVNERMVLVHGVWLKPEEIDLLGAKGAKLAYCPSSNMFLADGVTDIVRMRKAGVTVGLGSDGACSNNRVSIFEEMRMVSLLQKATTHDAMCVPYADAFRMGTEWGGNLLGLPVGKIEAGCRADFVGVDLNDLSMLPLSDSGEQLLPNVVYAMQPTAVKDVFVNGEFRVRDGELVTVPIERIAQSVRRITQNW